MKLFDYIPQNFFSILSSKNKDIYAIALIVLHKSLQTEEMSIKKEDYIRVLKEKANDIINNLDVDSEEEVDDDTKESLVNISSKVAFIVRRLEETGWIETELRTDTFDEYIILPTYSIQMLNVLYNFVSDQETAYNSLVHSTYIDLKFEDDEPDEFMYATLVRVYENTKNLKVELITLGHQIRMYQNRLSKFFTTNDILHDHFDEYKVRISDKLYHPLKTFDSVTKFKRPIINILQKWLRSEEIRSRIVMQAVAYGRSKSKEEVEADIIEKINYICDMYEQINLMVSDIDAKHSEYTKSSATKIIYLNNSDKSIKGHLETIFKAYAKANNDGKGLANILSNMQQSINVTNQGFIDPDSLTLPLVRNSRVDYEPMKIINTSEEAGDYMMDIFLREAQSSYTDEMIYEFMQRAFQGEQEVLISDIPLPSFDAFVLLILGTLKKDDDKCFYEVIQEEGKLHSQGYVLPNIKFKRKEVLN